MSKHNWKPGMVRTWAVMACFALAAGLVAGANRPAIAQDAGDTNDNGANNADNGDQGNNGDGTGNDNNGDNNNNGNNNDNNTVDNAVGGIVIDPLGVVRRHVTGGQGRLNRIRRAAAWRPESRDIFRPSECRKVSLNRLEQAARQVTEQGGQAPEEMLYLAGLTRVEHVFLFPESGDVVIAGPAEGWFAEADGSVFGLQSGQPVLRLEDLAAVLRAIPPESNRNAVISCSIDPTREGLARMQAFLHSIGGRPPAAEVIVRGLRESLGPHDVTIKGIPSTTRFAQILVAADYRMKLIGIGLERPLVRIKSYVDWARPGSRQNALARWYFVPDYECVRVSEDELALELVGQAVKLISQAEMVDTSGGLQKSARRDGASEKFVAGFTRQYPLLAERVPLYAELRNMIDLSVVAAYLRQYNAYARCQWTPDWLLDEAQFVVNSFCAPKQVGTAVTAVWRRSRLMTPVGGGVRIEPAKAFDSDNLLPDEHHALYSLRGSISLDTSEDAPWWWD